MKIKSRGSLIALLLVAMNTITKAQSFTCNYYGKKINEKALCTQFFGFKNKGEAEVIVKKIVDLSGLPQSFYLIECPNVDNCFATVAQEEAVIVYDNNFMKKANDITHNNWAEISILAHEIGHHLSMHTIKKGGSSPQKELEADSFSGFIMYKLGASLADAQAAIRKLTTEYDGGGTHPPKGHRLAAIENGYSKAKGINQGNNKVFVESKIQNSGTNKQETPIDESVIENKPATKTGNEMARNLNNRVGCIDGNCVEGYGIAINRNNEEKYKGYWHEGKREGRGVEYYKNGEKKYEGTYLMGKWNGSGTFFSKNGNIYIGKFIENKLNGEQCLVYFKNGERYIGKFENGKRIGSGLLIHRDGSREQVSLKGVGEIEIIENKN